MICNGADSLAHESCVNLLGEGHYCVKTAKNPTYGLNSFDNIYNSFLMVFLTTT